MQKIPQTDRVDPVEKLYKKIDFYQQQLDKLGNQKNFPYVYIVVAFPTTILFMLLTIVSEGLIDFTTGITGSLFFSLLITCAYLVLYQPNREEMQAELQKKITSLIREKNRLEAGIRGEKEVAYVLSWLPKTYVTLNNIMLPSLNFENQQFDHLVIGPNGIFHLETKNINGIVLIDEKGDWSVIRAFQNRLNKEGMESPLAQVKRHEIVLKEILEQEFPGSYLPVQSLVVMSNPRTIVEGHDPKLIVIKKDKLNEYIKSSKKESPLNNMQIKKIALALIKLHLSDKTS